MLAKSAPESVAPARPSGFSKPSTLIEAPLDVGWQRIAAWGIDLRTSCNRKPEAETQEAAASCFAPQIEVEEEEFVEETEEFEPEPHGAEPEFEASQLEEVSAEQEHEETYSADEAGEVQDRIQSQLSLIRHRSLPPY